MDTRPIPNKTCIYVYLYIYNTHIYIYCACAYKVDFKVQLSGFRTLSLINAHWHYLMAKVLNGKMRKSAVAWMVERIKKYKVRFVVGDFNMSAFQLLDDLRACGIECLVVSQHLELDWTCGDYLYDSCVIVILFF